MPTNRKRRTRGTTLNEVMFPAMAIHVEQGDCFLAGYGLGCACGLRGEDGAEREDLTLQIKVRMKADGAGLILRG